MLQFIKSPSVALAVTSTIAAAVASIAAISWITVIAALAAVATLAAHHHQQPAGVSCRDAKD